MKVTVFVNEKGGVGKTTLTGTAGAALAIQGAKVLLIDTDPQGTLADMFGMESAPHFHDFVMRKTPVKDLIEPVLPEVYSPTPPAGGLWIMPGNYETRSINDGTSDLFVLLKKLAALRDMFDVVIMDTSPTPSLLHGVVFMSANGVVFPSELTRPALRGIAATWQRLQDFSRMRETQGLPEIELYGIVPTKTRLNTKIQSKHINDLGAARAFAGKIWRPIPYRTLWEEAATDQKSIFAYAPDSEPARDGWRLANQLQEALYGEQQARAE